MGKMSYLVVLFICLINLGSGFQGVSGEKGCNGTAGDCFSYGGNMEFSGGEEAGDLLWHYAAGARWLLQSNGKTGNHALQQPDRGTCTTDSYSNCIVPDTQDPPPRSCPAYTRCQRSA